MCRTVQRLRNPRTVARLFIKDQHNEELWLRANHEVLRSIIDTDEFSAEQLMDATPFNLTYNKFYAIKNITRN